MISAVSTLEYSSGIKHDSITLTVDMAVFEILSYTGKLALVEGAGVADKTRLKQIGRLFLYVFTALEERR